MAKSEEIRKLFNDKKFGVFLAADETFLRCYEHGGSGEVLVPKRIKWIPPTSDSNEKEGHTLMLKIDMDSSQLLSSQITFTGMH